MKKLILVAALLTAGAFYAPAAHATGSYQCPNGSWVYEPSQCPTPPASNTNTNTNTAGAAAGAVAGAAAGAVSGSKSNATVGPITTGGATASAGVAGSGNSTVRNENRVTTQQKQDQYQQQNQSQQTSAINGGNRVNTQIDASSRHNYEAAANSIILGSAYAGEDECKVGFTAGGSTVGAQVGGGLNAIDKSCAVVRQMMRERVQICGMFGPQSRECASATYHTSAIGALSMVESGRVVEKSGPRVGIAPAKQPAREASIVKAWNEGEERRGGIDRCRLNPSKCD